MHHSHSTVFRNGEFEDRMEDGPKDRRLARLFDIQAVVHTIQQRHAKEQAVFSEKMKWCNHQIEGRGAPCRPSTRPSCGTSPHRAGDSGSGKDTVRANYPKRAMNLIEAPVDGTLDLQFYEDLKVDSYADLEYACWCHKK